MTSPYTHCTKCKIEGQVFCDLYPYGDKGEFMCQDCSNKLEQCKDEEEGIDFCPNCESHLITNVGNNYQCNNCETSWILKDEKTIIGKNKKQISTITIDEDLFSEIMKLIYLNCTKEGIANLERMIDKRNKKLEKFLYHQSIG